MQQWWHNATTGIGGVSAHHEQVVAFVARQLLDTVSPVEFHRNQSRSSQDARCGKAAGISCAAP